MYLRNIDRVVYSYPNLQHYLGHLVKLEMKHTQQLDLSSTLLVLGGFFKINQPASMVAQDIAGYHDSMSVLAPQFFEFTDRKGSCLLCNFSS